MSQIDPNQQPAIPSPESIDAQVERELEGKSMEDILKESAPAPEAPAAEGDEAPATFAKELKRGRVSAIDGDNVFIELAGIDNKFQGVVPLIQFERPPRIGSIMDFVLERLDAAEGVVHLSREGAVTRTTWDHLTKGAIVEARVTATNKGGLELEMVGGIKAFMPASQIDLHHIKDLEPLVGEKYHAVVQEIDRKGKRITISRRQFLEQERASKKAKLLEEIEVGQQREGKISNLVEYGAFVDLGGMDGLVHLSDMSYKHITKPGEVVKVGDTVTVKVLKIDKEKGRISLGMKQVTPDPWETLGTKYTVGEQISARILRTADFGAFVELEPGIEGLLPHSELSWKRHVKTSDVVKTGDVVRLVVMQIDIEKRRITLTLKQADGNPWADASGKYATGAMVEGTVISTPEFGAFIELEPGIEGMVHISELADRRVNAVTDILKVGEKKTFRVLDIDPENHRIRLSLKPIKEGAPAPKPGERKPAGGAPAPAARQSARPARPTVGKDGKPLKGGMDPNGGLGLGLGSLKL
jgi:small subunit ribosomal protein S1